MRIRPGGYFLSGLIARLDNEVCTPVGERFLGASFGYRRGWGGSFEYGFLIGQVWRVEISCLFAG